ncbi:hypothetical protein BDN70DRAFT_885786 [Pholiota conissans]|uniref:Uncharacterized protein n=1 Tax=Pholiota conissans TaxID=109636 RepID=A0A9P6CP24_9AGAR|nr:hypothetical protein BDN70DRAFT_885786 [Pholiota conissans]
MISKGSDSFGWSYVKLSSYSHAQINDISYLNRVLRYRKAVMISGAVMLRYSHFLKFKSRSM